MVAEIALLKKSLLMFLGELKKQLDPNRKLDETERRVVLEELARLFQLLEERTTDLAAAATRPEEVYIIAHQVFESMKRTADREKRRRLANVLVNGLCVEEWDKATHRMMVRFADELEEEHVARLARDVRTSEERRGDAMNFAKNRPEWPGTQANQKMLLDRQAVLDAIDQELFARKLLDEHITPASGPKKDHRELSTPERRTLRISRLGRLFLEYVRDPEGKDATEEPAKRSSSFVR